MTAKPTQVDAVKSALLSGKKINTVIAVEQLFIFRLASIIERLRKQGWPIGSERLGGNGIAEYSLPEGWQPPGDTKA
jgi:hypothetical protein